MRHGPRLLKEESGIALITGLLILMGLTAIGLFATNATIVHQDISASLKASKQGCSCEIRTASSFTPPSTR